jgi:AcrR family transcriptional regulator
MTPKKELWLNVGYEIFGRLGPKQLKIEKIAQKVGISKSSFYHHFADLDIFIEHLLEYHIRQSQVIAEKEKKAQNIDPELIQVLIEHKSDLLFNRQLRVNRENKVFAKILEESNRIVGGVFVAIWIRDLSLNITQKQIEGIFELALENFYLQINAENLNYDWLSAYFSNLKRIIQNLL